MARRLRVEYLVATYHLMNRGDRREPIFKDDEDRELFLQIFTETCIKTGWQVHACALMPNQFHQALGVKRFLQIPASAYDAPLTH